MAPPSPPLLDTLAVEGLLLYFNVLRVPQASRCSPSCDNVCVFLCVSSRL